MDASPTWSLSKRKAQVRLDIRRIAVTLRIAWPQEGLGELAGVVRELLKWFASTRFGWRFRLWTCGSQPMPHWHAWLASPHRCRDFACQETTS
jgi:hypothetical protein